MKPIKCFKKADELLSQLSLVGGVDMLQDLWKVPEQKNSLEAIIAVQAAMIEYEITHGLMPKSFLLKTRICVNIEVTATNTPESALAYLKGLVGAGSIPFGSRSKKQFVSTKTFVEVHGWSVPFEASMFDRIQFLEKEKIVECEDLTKSYPEVFSSLPNNCDYLSCVLKKVRKRS